MKPDFPDRFFKKNALVSNLIKISKMGAVFFHADRGTDGRTDRYDEANSLFSQFCECTYYAVGPSSHVPVSVIYVAHIIGRCTERFASRQEI
jgi:hypothetical protein